MCDTPRIFSWVFIPNLRFRAEKIVFTRYVLPVQTVYTYHTGSDTHTGTPTNQTNDHILTNPHVSFPRCARETTLSPRIGPTCRRDSRVRRSGGFPTGEDRLTGRRTGVYFSMMTACFVFFLRRKPYQTHSVPFVACDSSWHRDESRWPRVDISQLGSKQNAH